MAGEVHDAYSGDGYGIPTREWIDGIGLRAQTEDRFLDPVQRQGDGRAGPPDRNGALQANRHHCVQSARRSPALFAYEKEIVS